MKALSQQLTPRRLSTASPRHVKAPSTAAGDVTASDCTARGELSPRRRKLLESSKNAQVTTQRLEAMEAESSRKFKELAGNIEHVFQQLDLTKTSVADLDNRLGGLTQSLVEATADGATLVGDQLDFCRRLVECERVLDGMSTLGSRMAECERSVANAGLIREADKQLEQLQACVPEHQADGYAVPLREAPPVKQAEPDTDLDAHVSRLLATEALNVAEAGNRRLEQLQLEVTSASDALELRMERRFKKLHLDLSASVASIQEIAERSTSQERGGSQNVELSDERPLWRVAHAGLAETMGKIAADVVDLQQIGSSTQADVLSRVAEFETKMEQHAESQTRMSVEEVRDLEKRLAQVCQEFSSRSTSMEQRFSAELAAYTDGAKAAVARTGELWCEELAMVDDDMSRVRADAAKAASEAQRYAEKVALETASRAASHAAVAENLREEFASLKCEVATLGEAPWIQDHGNRVELVEVLVGAASRDASGAKEEARTALEGVEELRGSFFGRCLDECREALGAARVEQGLREELTSLRGEVAMLGGVPLTPAPWRLSPVTPVPASTVGFAVNAASGDASNAREEACASLEGVRELRESLGHRLDKCWHDDLAAAQAEQAAADEALADEALKQAKDLSIKHAATAGKHEAHRASMQTRLEYLEGLIGDDSIKASERDLSTLNQTHPSCSSASTPRATKLGSECASSQIGHVQQGGAEVRTLDERAVDQLSARTLSTAANVTELMLAVQRLTWEVGQDGERAELAHQEGLARMAAELQRICDVPLESATQAVAAEQLRSPSVAEVAKRDERLCDLLALSGTPADPRIRVAASPTDALSQTPKSPSRPRSKPPVTPTRPFRDLSAYGMMPTRLSPGASPRNR